MRRLERSFFYSVSRCSFLVCVALSLIVHCAAAGSFRAAATKVDITPKRPQWMHGYGPRKSEGVNDRIQHRIVAMDDGDTTFYLVASDICTVTPSFCDDVLARLNREAGIEPGQVWWTATHTHAAPHVGPQDLGSLFQRTLGDRFSMKHDTNHWNFVVGRLIEGVKTVRKELEPARLAVAVGEAKGNVNRRQRMPDGRIRLGVNPDGPADRQMGVMRVERPDGSLIALVANYAIHGTALGGRNRVISGDITGFVANHVEKEVGVPTLFTNGAEGNIAPLYSIGNDFGSPRLKELTESLGARVMELSKSAGAATDDVSLSLDMTWIETRRRKGLGWIDALAAYAGKDAEGAPTVRVPVRSLVINGSTAIWAAPLELFSEISINVREASPFSKTLYFGLTNGSLLYMPTRAAFSEGGYEVGVSPFTPQAEEDFTSGVSSYLKELAVKEGR